MPLEIFESLTSGEIADRVARSLLVQNGYPADTPFKVQVKYRKIKVDGTVIDVASILVTDPDRETPAPKQEPGNG